jgi:molybdopterin synthase sulfur carrier subunit
MEITVYGPLRSATGEKTVNLDFEGETVGDALETFVAQYPRARSQLYTDDGAIRPSVRVTVDGERADLDASCPDDGTLTLHPAMRGG